MNKNLNINIINTATTNFSSQNIDFTQKIKVSKTETHVKLTYKSGNNSVVGTQSWPALRASQSELRSNGNNSVVGTQSCPALRASQSELVLLLPKVMVRTSPALRACGLEDNERRARSELEFFFDCEQIDHVLFIQWIRELEDNLIYRLKANNFESIFTENSAKIPIQTESKKILIYDNTSGEFIKFSTIPHNSEAEALIHISSVVLNQKTLTMNWEVLQLRIFPPLEITTYLLERNLKILDSDASNVASDASESVSDLSSESISLSQVCQSSIIPLPPPLPTPKTQPKTPPVPNFKIDNKTEPALNPTGVRASQSEQRSCGPAQRASQSEQRSCGPSQSYGRVPSLKEIQFGLQPVSSTSGHTSTVFPKRTIIPVCTGKAKESRSCLCFV